MARGRVEFGRGFGADDFEPGVAGWAMRWMVFDDETAEIVVSQWRRGAAEILHDAPVDATLQTDGPAVLVMPSRVPGQVMVARFKKSTAAVSVAPATTAAPVMVESSVRKPWWRKFVA